MPFAASGTDRKGKSGIFRRPENSPKEANKITNVFKNAILPLSTGPMIKGSAVYVALEVAVSKILRMVMGADNKGFIELAVVHTMSLALMGGVGASMSSTGEGLVPYGEKKVSQHVKQGVKGIPALFLANYIYNTFFYGFYQGNFSTKNLLIMAAAKILTRPIASKIYPMSKFTQNAFEAQQLMETAQSDASNFKRIKQGDLYRKA
jgi:hypothetical protein